MRRALVSIVVLLAACESQSSSSGFGEARRDSVCGITEPCGTELPPKGIPPMSGLIIENDSEVELKVGSFSLPFATIDARVVDRTLDIEIPTSVLPAPFTQFVPAHGIHPIAQPIFVTDFTKGSSLTPEMGAVLEVGGVTALYIGKGTLRTRRVDGVLQLVPIDSTKVRIVSFAKDAPICQGEASRITVNSPGSALEHDFTIGEVTRSEGCTTVQLKPIVPTDGERQIRFCVPEEAWPFVSGDQVRFEDAAFFFSSKEGLRLRRGDGKVFELARLESTPENAFVGADITAQINTTCLRLNEPPTTCRAVSLGASVTPSGINITGGRAWVASATIPAFSADCTPAKSPLVEIVARSE